MCKPLPSTLQNEAQHPGESATTTPQAVNKPWLAWTGSTLNETTSGCCTTEKAQRTMPCIPLCCRKGAPTRVNESLSSEGAPLPVPGGLNITEEVRLSILAKCLWFFSMGLGRLQLRSVESSADGDVTVAGQQRDALLGAAAAGHLRVSGASQSPCEHFEEPCTICHLIEAAGSSFSAGRVQSLERVSRPLPCKGPLLFCLVLDRTLAAHCSSPSVNAGPAARHHTCSKGPKRRLAGAWPGRYPTAMPAPSTRSRTAEGPGSCRSGSGRRRQR